MNSTALGATAENEGKMIFISEAHEKFYYEKLKEVRYQDVGQIDFYVKYFEENVKTEGDNPTIGIVLCSEKNETRLCYQCIR